MSSCKLQPSSLVRKINNSVKKQSFKKALSLSHQLLETCQSFENTTTPCNSRRRHKFHMFSSRFHNRQGVRTERRSSAADPLPLIAEARLLVLQRAEYQILAPFTAVVDLVAGFTTRYNHIRMWVNHFLANSFRPGRFIGPLHLNGLSQLQLRSCFTFQGVVESLLLLRIYQLFLRILWGT